MKVRHDGCKEPLPDAGNAYMEMMQQIMAAVQSAPQLEVTDLLQDRSPDGSLLSPPDANGTTEGQSAAGSVTSLLKRQPTDARTDNAQEAGSQMPNAKRQKIDREEDGGHAMDQAGVTETGDQEQGPPQSSALADRPESLPAIVSTSSTPAADAARGHDHIHALAIARDDVPGGSDNAAGAQCMAIDMMMPTAGPNGSLDVSLPDQVLADFSSTAGASAGLPDQDTANGPDQAASCMAVPDQATANGFDQPGPSTALPDQDTEKEVDVEMKEKKEQARHRLRAWRKVLLDGLDLLTEMMCAAVDYDPDDSSDLQECKVRQSWASSYIGCYLPASPYCCLSRYLSALHSA